MTLNEACREILKSKKANGYAKAYAQAGLQMRDTDPGARIQAVYILNNIPHWRGENSKEVRAALKAIAGL